MYEAKRILLSAAQTTFAVTIIPNHTEHSLSLQFMMCHINTKFKRLIWDCRLFRHGNISKV
jgi:hypothetical protein